MRRLRTVGVSISISSAGGGAGGGCGCGVEQGTDAPEVQEPAGPRSDGGGGASGDRGGLVAVCGGTAHRCVSFPGEREREEVAGAQRGEHGAFGAGVAAPDRCSEGEGGGAGAVDRRDGRDAPDRGAAGRGVAGAGRVAAGDRREAPGASAGRLPAHVFREHDLPGLWCGPRDPRVPRRDHVGADGSCDPPSVDQRGPVPRQVDGGHGAFDDLLAGREPELPDGDHLEVLEARREVRGSDPALLDGPEPVRGRPEPDRGLGPVLFAVAVVEDRVLDRQPVERREGPFGFGVRCRDPDLRLPVRPHAVRRHR